MDDHTHSRFDREFDEYARAARGDDATPQLPAEELLAEHHIMEEVLAAMEHEAGEMKGGGVLRSEFWSTAIRFIGEFVLGHRGKEHRFFAVANDTEQAQTVQKEHQIAENLTVHLLERASEGDWEGVIRVVSAYVYFMRPHMRREEDRFFRQAMTSTTATDEELTAAFRQEERRAWGERRRQHYLELAADLCAQTGVHCSFEV